MTTAQVPVPAGGHEPPARTGDYLTDTYRQRSYTAKLRQAVRELEDQADEVQLGLFG